MTQRSRRHHGSLADAAEQTGLSTHPRRRTIAEGRLTRRGGRRVIRLLDPDDVDHLIVEVRLPPSVAKHEIDLGLIPPPPCR